MRLLLGMALLSVLAMPAAAHGAQLFIATERPFDPDSAGAIVKLEVPGARSVDVRLYRLWDLERFFAGQADLRHVENPAGKEPSGKTAQGGHRAPGPVALVAGALSLAALDARLALDHGLSPAARALLAASVQGPRAGGAEALPFLRGLDLVERWDLACGAGDAEFSYCDLDIGPRPSGAYLVEAVAGKEVAHAVALFSHLSVVARRTEGTLAVLAVDTRTGQASSGANVAVFPQGQTPIHGTTTRQGLFIAKVPARPIRVVARQGTDAAVLELGPVTAVSSERDTLLVTDRGEYRPGERLFFHGFARTAEERLSPPRAEHVEIAAYDARGSLFHSGDYPLSPQGGFGGDLFLPLGLPEGLYRLVATIEGHSAGGEFAVRDAPSPAFALEATVEAPAPGLPARAAVRASVEGRPRGDVRVLWRAVRTSLSEEGPGSPEEVDRGDLAVGPDGRATFGFDTLGGADARYQVTAVAHDPAGRIATAQAAATVLRHPLRVALLTEHRLVPPGTPASVSVLAHEADRPVAVDLKVKVQSARSGASGEASHEKALFQELRTGPDGRATISFTPTSTGYYEVEVSRGGERLAETFLYVTAEGGDIPFSPDTLALVPDQATYAVGDTARVLLLAPFDAAVALVTVEGADLLRPEALPIRGASAVYQIKVTRELAPDFTVSAQAILGDKTWKSQRTLKVTPRGEVLTVHGSLGTAGPAPDSLHLEVEVLDRSSKPVPGAELFAVIRDERSLSAAVPPIFSFFHPTRLSDGVTASSTSYRNSSSGLPFPRAASEAVDEGYLPFKGLSQGRPRPPDRGTLLAVGATTDSRGRALLPFKAPPDVGHLVAEVWAAAGPAVGEWTGTQDRAMPALLLSAPRFLRPGDEAIVQARVTSSVHPVSLELSSEGTSARGVESASLKLGASAPERTLYLRLEGLGSLAERVLPAPGQPVERRGVAGIAWPGRTPLPLPPGSGPAVLMVASGPGAAAAGARRAMADPVEPSTSRTTARLLMRLAEWKARSEPSPEMRAAALADVAALVGLAHPEGSFGAYDGGPADVELTAWALLALALARDEGLDVEEGVLARGSERLLALKGRGLLASLVLSILEELPPQGLAGQLEKERTAGLPPAGRALLAWALEASGSRAEAREVAARLERSARFSANAACFAEACPPADAARESVRSTALAMLALRRIRPRSPVLAPAVRWLLQVRGTGDFGGDLAAGLASLAVAESAEVAPSGPAVMGLEAQGRALMVPRRLPADAEAQQDLSEGAATLLVTGAGPVYWRVEREVALAPRGGLTVARELAPVEPDAQGPIHVGDRVVVTLTLAAQEKLGPVRIDDPYPAGLSPIEQEGEHEPFRMLDERARRIFLPDRVVFLLPSLKAGETVLRWEAVARVAGRFSAAPAVVAAADARGLSEPLALAIEEAER